MKKLLLALVVFVALALPTAAMGLSPGEATVYNVLRGGYSERGFRVYNTEPSTVQFKIELRGVVKDWVVLVPGDTLEVGPSQVAAITLQIQPPQDTPNGLYEGLMVVTGTPVAAGGEGSISRIATGVQARVAVEVVDKEVLSLIILETRVESIEQNQPLVVAIRAKNAGNVRATPKVTVRIIDSSGQTVKTAEDASTEILPTQSRDLKVVIPTLDLETGRYTAHVSITVGGDSLAENRLDFEILEKGALRRQGELLGISGPGWVKVGEAAKLVAKFKNSGQVASDAKFTAEIYVDGALIDTATSETIEVAPGDTSELPVIFKPDRPGRFVVRGSVFYSKRRTPESEFILNVQPLNALSFDLYYAIIVLILALAVGFAVYKRTKHQPPTGSAGFQ